MTDEDRKLLEQYAVEVDDGTWVLQMVHRSAGETVNLIKAMLYLGERPQDTLTSRAFSNLVLKVKALEEGMRGGGSFD